MSTATLDPATRTIRTVDLGLVATRPAAGTPVPARPIPTPSAGVRPAADMPASRFTFRELPPRRSRRLATAAAAAIAAVTVSTGTFVVVHRGANAGIVATAPAVPATELLAV